MPNVFKVGSFRFFFYSYEGNLREPVHIHVESGDENAKFWIRPDVRLARNNGYSEKTLRRLRKIIEGRADLIEERWDEFFS